MAATQMYNYFSNSSRPEKPPKTTLIHGVLLNSMTKLTSKIQKSKHSASKPPTNHNLTRELTEFVNSGSMNNALNLFDKMPHPDTYIWNLILRGFCNNGLFQEVVGYYFRMVFDGIRTDKYTFPFVIKACGRLLNFIEGEKVHAKLIKIGLDFDVYVCNCLIDMYFKLGLVENAEKVFEGMQVRDLVSWNSMVGGYQYVGDGLKSLILFREMLNFGCKVDRFSIISAIGACSSEGFLHGGKEIHCHVIRSGLNLDIMVQTSLIDLYAKCGEMDHAERVFSGICCRNIVAWNAMIGGYALNGDFFQSFASLKRMQEDDDLIPDAITIINLLPSCSHAGALIEGQCLHAYAIRKMFLPNFVLETALLDMYGKCGKLELAKFIFGRINEKNLVSWNTMIAAFVQNGQNKEALELFHYIWREALKPDAITIASIIPAYAELASVSEGKQLHSYGIKLKMSSNTIISNALINMYAKCGDLDTARQIFDGMLCKNIVSWNTMILAYGIHGYGRISVQLFSEMREKGIEPNESTFVSLLSSCSISGLVDEGWELFNSMKMDYNIDPGIEHFGCMLDLLGRTGNLEEAKRFIDEMPLAPTARIWGSLLTASRKNNNIALAELATDNILSLEHDNTGCYVLLSNMYAEAGRWEDVKKIELLMGQKGIMRTISCSTVQTIGGSEKFYNQDRSQREKNMIYLVLDIIMKKIDEDSYVHLYSKFRPADLLNENKNAPVNHSVRLGICFGLITTALGKPVIVRKNTRICGDCHRVAKKISLVTKREIVIGDCKIFHHFVNGICSCGDYW